ncbi:MAG: IS200/IS605 family transposase, partial [Alphaproteobacteria bacterium]
MNVIYKRNCVYQIAYHVVWCVKYRKVVLKKGIAIRTKELIDNICAENSWELISQEIQPDHIHL